MGVFKKIPAMAKLLFFINYLDSNELRKFIWGKIPFLHTGISPTTLFTFFSFCLLNFAHSFLQHFLQVLVIRTLLILHLLNILHKFLDYVTFIFWHRHSLYRIHSFVPQTYFELLHLILLMINLIFKFIWVLIVI